MTEPKIQEIEANLEAILQLSGEESLVDWETFTKSSTTIIKTLEELAKSIAVLREVQQKKFMATMKKLKGADVPDLLKTVRSKKLPPQALRAIVPRLTITDGTITLKNSIEELRAEAKGIFEEYINTNDEASKRARDTVDFLTEKVKQSGLYEEPPEIKELVSTFKHQFSEEALEKARKAVQVKYLPNTVDTIHITTYAQIVDGTFEVVKDEYKRLTIEARSKQRALTKDTSNYLEALTEFLTNTEVLILQGQKAIASKAGISPQKLEEAEGTLMERGLGQNILFLQSQLRTRVKESIVASRPVSAGEAKKILKYQVGLLSSKVEYFKELFGKMDKNQETLQLVPMILALALNDMVFEEHGLEEEDIMKEVTDQMILTNPEFSELFKELEIKIIKLMELIGAIPQQISQYMQNQSALPMGIQGGNLPPGFNPMAGGFPGSNPLDLIQLQQFQQLQQSQQEQGKK